ncbi:MAG: 1-phosphofructokinase family hexose kinase [Anaerolineae bacterium]|nr:1-phosphofructokinase family hexose kinase [Anaerolineae bacterium]
MTIVTLTANTALDQTVFIDSFTPNLTIRARETVLSMAGKPTDASYILGQMGVSSRAMGFVAGVTGETIKNMLATVGVQADFVRASGQSRINTVIIAEADDTHTTITTTSLRVLPEHIDQLRERYAQALDYASCVIMGGSLPTTMSPDFYTEFIRVANENGVPTILDVESENLRAGLKSRPTFIKPNEHELAEFTGQRVDSLETAYAAGQQILKEFGTSSVITLGGRGALAILPDRAYYVPSIPVEVVSPAGAGDAVLAGLALAIERDEAVEEGLRYGIAMASAVVMQPGTAVLDPADARRFMAQVELEPYAP